MFTLISYIGILISAVVVTLVTYLGLRAIKLI
uniref:Cytochrome b6-f complex subunit 6 n=1 Tax=Nephroselmis astigmatica TaxID=259378 RepID=A0A088CKB9_9CHLO|nr:subunit VI of cytochrome b6/f complex [Nephroselmis astigmatica]AID67689.1 subunit VI of cytochrome b6/f complex [Nephroselmis astigmatica]